MRSAGGDEKRRGRKRRARRRRDARGGKKKQQQSEDERWRAQIERSVSQEVKHQSSACTAAGGLILVQVGSVFDEVILA